MEMLPLLLELHASGKRQGPGGDTATQQALSHVLPLPKDATVLDIGCGTGAQTFVLAQSLPGNIVAVDTASEFLQVLASTAAQRGYKNITTHAAFMEALPFPDAAFDGIWSEGAIYNMGFAAGLTAWRRLLKPGGFIALTEITWTTKTRPAAIQAYWDTNYPAITTLSDNIATLRRCGYTPVAHFTLLPECWLKNYYAPLAQREPAFAARHANNPLATQLLAINAKETAMYQQFQDFYGYVFYIAKAAGV